MWLGACARPWRRLAQRAQQRRRQRLLEAQQAQQAQQQRGAVTLHRMALIDDVCGLFVQPLFLSLYFPALVTWHGTD